MRYMNELARVHECDTHFGMSAGAAQIALGEPAADVARILDQYETVLTRPGYAIYAGELHELQAQLAEREGPNTERGAALRRARACYAAFGMTRAVKRVENLRQA